MKYIVDIETGPDNDRAKAIMPPFDLAEVKVGNLGPEKAQEKINAAKSSHEADWLDKAALRPETGTILAIGIQGDKTAILHVKEMKTEAAMLKMFWELFTDSQKTNAQWAGWNINQFDLPFLTLRSRILGVTVPAGLRSGRYWNNSMFVELMDEWLCGRNRNEVKCSLGYVAKALGVGEKTGDGSEFAVAYHRNTEKALEYLRNDLKLTAGVGKILGY